MVSKPLVKKVAKAKPTAENQKTQILSLAKKVSTLNKSMRAKRIYSQYSMHWKSNVIAAHYVVQPLIRPQIWDDVFNKPAIFENKNTAWIKSIGIDNYVSIYTEDDSRIDFTYFLVSVKAGQGMKLFNDAGDDLTSLTDGVHYKRNTSDTLGYSGQVFMNKSIFNIHYIKRFSLTNRPSPSVPASEMGKSTNLASTFKRFYHKKTRINKPLTSKDGVAGWRVNLDEGDVPTNARFYLLLFNNNSAADVEFPNWAGNVIVTMQV